MTATTPQPPGSGGADGVPARPARVIQNETTTEIPVHLLFRDDPDPVSVPLRPTVVNRRQGTGEQPRLRRPAPAKARPVARIDLDLVERPARALPGAVGVLAGAVGLAGCAVTSWWAGTLPPFAAQALGLPAFAGVGLGPAQWAGTPGPGRSACSASGDCPGGAPGGPGCSICSAATGGPSGVPA